MTHLISTWSLFLSEISSLIRPVDIHEASVGSDKDPLYYMAEAEKSSRLSIAAFSPINMVSTAAYTLALHKQIVNTLQHKLSDHIGAGSDDRSTAPIVAP